MAITGTGRSSRLSFLPVSLQGPAGPKGDTGVSGQPGPPGPKVRSWMSSAQGSTPSVNPEGQSWSTPVTTPWEGGAPGRSHGLPEVWDRVSA